MIVISIDSNNFRLEGDLMIPDVQEVRGLIIFAHGSGSGKNSPRNQYVGRILKDTRFATLIIDLLTREEQDADVKAQKLNNKIPGIILNKFNIKFLAKRAVKTNKQTQHFKIGYFGASTGTAAAIEAAAAPELRNHILAIVSRGGRPDLASTNSLKTINGATMLIVGDKDSKVIIDLNKKAFKELRSAKERRLVMVPDAGHLFEESGTIDEVGQLTLDWFRNQM